MIQRPATIAKDMNTVGQPGKPAEAECCRPAPSVIEFDAAGNFVQAWGGPSPDGKYDWPQAPAATLRQKVGMGANDNIDPHRLLDLSALLAELVCSLDQVVWSAWRQIAPQANVKRPASLQKTMGRFAAGDQDTPRGQVSQDLNKLRALTAGLIAACADGPSAPASDLSAQSAQLERGEAGPHGALTAPASVLRTQPLAQDITVSVVIDRRGGTLEIPEA